MNRNWSNISIGEQEYEPYYIGIFLGGAYQEIMGNYHNLFGKLNTVHVSLNPESDNGYVIDYVSTGDTIGDAVSYVHYDVPNLLDQIRLKTDYAVQNNTITNAESDQIIQCFERSLQGYTYLKIP